MARRTRTVIHVMLSAVCLLLTGRASADDEGFPDSPPVAPLQKGVKLAAPYTETLDNNMDLVVITNSEIPWVSVSWRLLAGAKHDPVAKPGLASLVAGMLDQGTENYTSDQFSEKADYHAVSISGSAGHESTIVTASSLSDKLEIAVGLLAEAVRRPVFPDKDFTRVQKQAVQGLQISEQDGGFQAGRVFDEWLYGDHFLARPASGTSATVSVITREDLAEFHKKHYLPNHSTLMFSGDIQAGAALDLARRFFGDWDEDEMPPAPQSAPAPGEATRVVIVDRPSTQQVQIRMGHLGYTRRDPDYVPGQIFNQVFGGSFVSRLNKRIRVQEGLTYGARGGFTTGKEPGVLNVSTFTRPEKTGEAVKALLDEVQKIRDIPPSDEELNDAKSYIIGSFSLSMETPQDVAGKIWDLKFHNLPYNWYETYLGAVEGSSGDRIQEFARKWVDPAKLKIVVVGREDEVRPQLEEVAPVTVIKPGEKVPAPAQKDLPPT